MENRNLEIEPDQDLERPLASENDLFHTPLLTITGTHVQVLHQLIRPSDELLHVPELLEVLIPKKQAEAKEHESDCRVNDLEHCTLL